MTVVWGDNKLNTPGAEKVWKALVFHRTREMISAVTVDQGPAGSTSMRTDPIAPKLVARVYRVACR
jgi:hypothetical protein